MKIVAIQPEYSEKGTGAFEYIKSALESITEADLIVTPEYSNVAPLHDRAEVMTLTSKSAPELLDICKETAARCSAVVCVNMLWDEGFGLRNTTFAIDKTGSVVFRYNKLHLPPAEKEDLALDYGYCGKSDCVFTHDGVTYAFLTCYDIYFSEQIEYIASRKPDVIIFPSYQRGEREDIILAQCKLASFRTNAVLIRCSHSMGANSKCGGNTSVFAPDGREIAHFGQKVGTLTCDADISAKYYRSGGYGKPKMLSGDFIEYGLLSLKRK